MAIVARSNRRLLRLAVITVLAGIVGLFITPASPAVAATGGCYGASCAGRNPMGLCDGDAYTVHSLAIIADGVQYAGQLDLRYSPSCKANWGRFTAASGWREATLWSMGSPIPISGRVTAWNPGGPSQQPIQGNVARLSFRGYSTWTAMVDGRGMACTGVEPFFGDSSYSGNIESKGWFWGPCA